MPELIGTSSGTTASFATKEYPVANGVTVNDGDYVYFSGGRVTNATIAGATILGIVSGGQSNNLSASLNAGTAATGDANGTVKVLVIIEPQAKFIIPVNSGTLSATNLGGRYNLVGATGAQKVDISTGGTQVECIATDYKGDNTRGVFIVNKHEYKVSA